MDTNGVIAQIDEDLSGQDLIFDGPSLIFESLTFSDDTTISLSPNDIVVFVGPNNAGKSAALRDLVQICISDRIRQVKTQIVPKAKLQRVGTVEQLRSFLEVKSKVIGNTPGRSFQLDGVSIAEQNLIAWGGGDLSQISRFFCFMMPTESRLTDSNPRPAISLLEQPPNHPIHILYLNDALEKKVSGYFKEAFGKELIVYRCGGGQVPLLVGELPDLLEGEDRLSTSYNKRMVGSCVQLQQQGDGMRSFATLLLRALTPAAMTIGLLDEPEAFLHPPQARLIGEIIARERLKNSQLFISTHSQDILQGLLNVSPGNLRIIRLERCGNVNKVKELDKDLAREISADPLMRYTSVLSGVFHKRVIICESDADCMFYNAILDIPSVHGPQHPDVLFVHASGKHRMASLAKALLALGVIVDVIADIDVLNDLTVFKKLVVSLGAEWSGIEQHAKPLKAAIESGKMWLSADEVVKQIREVIERKQEAGAFPPKYRDEITDILGSTSPWGTVKKSGKTAIPPGDATKNYKQLDALCRSIGLWIVPVGEVEGFCRSEGLHGPKWVQNVLEKHDPESSEDLIEAREFVKKLWDRVPS